MSCAAAPLTQPLEAFYGPRLLGKTCRARVFLPAEFFICHSINTEARAPLCTTDRDASGPWATGTIAEIGGSACLATMRIEYMREISTVCVGVNTEC